MNEYIVCFVDDTGKSLMSKTNTHNEFEIYKKFMDWCAYKSGYLKLLYEQKDIKNSIDSYVKNMLVNEYIDDSHEFNHKSIVLDISITRLNPRKHITYTKSLVINIELYFIKEPNDKISFNCTITDINNLYSLDCLTV